MEFFYGKLPDEPGDKKVRVIKRDESIPMVCGDINKILVEYFVSTDRMHCGIFTVPPNSRGEDTPPHEGDEFYYVIKGQGVLAVEEKQYYRIGAGESGYLPAGYNHYWLNFSEETLEVLFVLAPDM